GGARRQGRAGARGHDAPQSQGPQRGHARRERHAVIPGRQVLTTDRRGGVTVMLARFFIDRPVLAWVISIVIVLLGGIAAAFLPVAEYPEITPPTVRVTASYPGANSRVVADTVAAPIEQQVVGVEGMMYMSSQSNSDGSYTLDVTFALGTDVNMAQVLVQNRVAIAEPTLPDVVRTIGVAVKKRTPDVLLGISLYSEDDPDTGRPY